MRLTVYLILHFLCKLKVFVVSLFSEYPTLIFCGRSTHKAITKIIVLELIYASQMYFQNYHQGVNWIFPFTRW